MGGPGAQKRKACTFIFHANGLHLIVGVSVCIFDIVKCSPIFSSDEFKLL